MKTILSDSDQHAPFFVVKESGARVERVKSVNTQTGEAVLYRDDSVMKRYEVEGDEAEDVEGDLVTRKLERFEIIHRYTKKSFKDVLGFERKIDFKFWSTNYMSKLTLLRKVFEIKVPFEAGEGVKEEEVPDAFSLAVPSFEYDRARKVREHFIFYAIPGMAGINTEFFLTAMADNGYSIVEFVRAMHGDRVILIDEFHCKICIWIHKATITTESIKLDSIPSEEEFLNMETEDIDSAYQTLISLLAVKFEKEYARRGLLNEEGFTGTELVSPAKQVALVYATEFWESHERNLKLK